MSENDPTAGGPRKPRIALMGEFSAGKSTLSNLLMGARPLPEKVTATRLSPVWMSQGSDTPYRIDVDGTIEPITLDQLESVPVEETFAIRLFLDVDILSVCDLIDFPGISDPNMSSEVWERVLPEVDAVIWCTHATQAWRQSEAAVWENMPDAVREHSILLITRFDKLTNERDKTRVIKRVTRETEGQFSGIYPVSLLQAIAAGDDQEKWDASGAGPFVYRLIETIEKLTKIAECTERPLYNIPNGQAIPTRVLRSVAPRRVVRSRDGDTPKRERPPAEPEAGQENPPGPILRSS
ncbi:GTPase [Cognatiyoonia sp. IB215446]|uniref:dynamin family protein n=1 Tax=Cognatiyoonia sp. IB215446 TaxID=3097355 RepID=UPI002A157A75|nr:dynamin family protein [Cognatiyoonia sp. IB215446]MDX8346533.1 GTPase [Cognatiyoonia sp. IB215446]